MRGLIENEGARGGVRCGFGARLQDECGGRRLFPVEIPGTKFVGRQAGGYQCAEGGIGAGNGNDGDAGGDGFSCQPGTGSLMPGIPASETRAMAFPALMFWISSVARVCSLCWWQLTVGVAIWKWLRSFWSDGVFAGDAVYLLEDLDGAEGDVA